MNSKNNIKKIQNNLISFIEFKNDEDKLDFETSVISLDLTDKIEELMKEYKMTKAQLARELKTSKSYITQLFNGDKLINLKLLARIQRIFKVKFYVGTNPSTHNSQQYKKFQESKRSYLKVSDGISKKR